MEGFSALKSGMSRITLQRFFAVGGQLRKNLYIASNIGHADKSNSDILNIDGHGHHCCSDSDFNSLFCKLWSCIDSRK